MYVFEENGGVWSETAKVHQPNALDTGFGVYVDHFGCKIVVGSCYDNVNGAIAGSAAVYVRESGGWSQESQLVDGDGIQFGSALLTYRAYEDPSATLEFERKDPSMSPPSDRAEQGLQMLCRIGTTVGSTRDSEGFVHQLVVALRDVLGCERAIVRLGESVRDGIRKIARSDKPGDDVVVSRSILEAVLGRRQQAVFIQKTDANAPPTILRERIRVAACVPILAGERLFGFLYADDSRSTLRFTQEDIQFLVALAHLAGGVHDGVDRLYQANDRIVALDRCEIVCDYTTRAITRRNYATRAWRRSPIMTWVLAGPSMLTFVAAPFEFSEQSSYLCFGIALL